MKKLIPKYIAVDLTYNCQLKCNFCFLKNNLSLPKETLNIEEWIKIIKILSNDIKKFYITGGEPFLYDNINLLIKSIKSYKHYILLTTNLTVPINNNVYSIENVDELIISVHKKYEDFLEWLGEKKRKIFLENLKIVKKNSRNISIWITINQDNYSQLNEIYTSIIKNINPNNIAINHLEYISQSEISQTNDILNKKNFEINIKPSESNIKNINIKRLKYEINKIKSNSLFSRYNTKFYPDIDDEKINIWYTPQIRLKRKCMSLINSLWISSKGEIISCQPLSIKIDKLNTNLKIEEIYNSRRYNQLRYIFMKNNWMLPACNRCGRAPFIKID